MPGEPSCQTLSNVILSVVFCTMQIIGDYQYICKFQKLNRSNAYQIICESTKQTGWESDVQNPTQNIIHSFEFRGPSSVAVEHGMKISRSFKHVSACEWRISPFVIFQKKNLGKNSQYKVNMLKFGQKYINFIKSMCKNCRLLFVAFLWKLY